MLPNPLIQETVKDMHFLQAFSFDKKFALTIAFICNIDSYKTVQVRPILYFLHL